MEELFDPRLVHSTKNEQPTREHQISRAGHEQQVQVYGCHLGGLLRIPQQLFRATRP